MLSFQSRAVFKRILPFLLLFLFLTWSSLWPNYSPPVLHYFINFHISSIALCTTVQKSFPLSRSHMGESNRLAQCIISVILIIYCRDRELNLPRWVKKTSAIGDTWIWSSKWNMNCYMILGAISFFHFVELYLILPKTLLIDRVLISGIIDTAPWYFHFTSFQAWNRITLTPSNLEMVMWLALAKGMWTKLRTITS